MAVGKFEKDIMHLVNKLCEGEDTHISREIKRLGESLISLHKKNLVKIVIGLFIIEYAVNLMLVLVGYRSGGSAPIVTSPENAAQQVATFVDPLPQAMVLTAIVIGVAVLALALSLAIRLYQHYGTLNLRKIREQKW